MSAVYGGGPSVGEISILVDPPKNSVVSKSDKQKKKKKRSFVSKSACYVTGGLWVQLLFITFFSGGPDSCLGAL